MNKLFAIILGISLSGFGICIIINPHFHDKKHDAFYDFSGIEWPFGIVLMILGSAFIILSCRKSANDIGNVLICPRCEKTFRKHDTNKIKCPTCAEELEVLEGFYDRHPEVKLTSKKT